ncbi:hypothetical protein XA68_14557 [Ophiocordyceps unilateralis]|uniref:Uncharacterized protein n=1 Tax=Ophiocordyceps unilateralis TaxID=268505 RepID=A0A2A9PA72_OPHUN|nr:hypothetical protein XA68_14557 [Ophiocordyceps unilateralis]
MSPRIRRDVNGGLPPATIAGIVVGVVLIFALAALLFLVYYRREQAMDELDDEASTDAGHSTCKTRRECRGRGLGGDSRLFGSSGDYQDYDMVNRQMYAPYRDTYTRNLDSAIPTHPAYIPSTRWPRSRPPPEPLLPNSQTVPVRSNRPDSYAVQAYLAAAEESARLAGSTPVVHTRTERPRSRTLGLPLASLPRLSIPSKQAQARAEMKTPGGRHQGLPMQTVQPAFRHHGRIRHGRPVAVAVAEWRPGSRQQARHDDGFIEVPLRSGKSTLFGY